MDYDQILAWQLQQQADGKVEDPFENNRKRKKTIDFDEEWIDPCPDIYELFIAMNHMYFYNKLLGIEVKWSERMTLCAGLCYYEGKGGLCSIRLSEPLLRYRPRSDLINTLLHEMIHAYLFVIANNRDHNAHGPEFLKHMHRINEKETNITIYHNFHEEVDSYRKHIWLCQGPCRATPPYFGLVKRALNRSPQPKDTWWEKHQRTCGGTFVKIASPEVPVKKILTKNNKAKLKQGKVILPDTSKKNINVMMPFISDNGVKQESKKPESDNLTISENNDEKTSELSCPICGNSMIDNIRLNQHLDDCLSYEWLHREEQKNKKTKSTSSYTPKFIHVINDN